MSVLPFFFERIRKNTFFDLEQCLTPGASRSGHKQSSYVAKSATSLDRLMPVASRRRLTLFLCQNVSIEGKGGFIDEAYC